METLFKLPSIAPVNIAIKFACVAAACLVVWWLVTLVLLKVRSRYKGDLKVAIRSFWASVIVYPLLQIYTLLELNYNLGELGVAVMRTSSFYLAFIPEFLASAGLVGSILFKRKRIIDGLDLRHLEAE